MSDISQDSCCDPCDPNLRRVSPRWPMWLHARRWMMRYMRALAPPSALRSKVIKNLSNHSSCHMLSYVVTLNSMLEEHQTSEKGRCWSTLWTRNLNELEWTLVNIWVNQKEAWHRRHGLFPLPSWCPRCWCRCIAMQQFSRLEPSRPSRPLAQLVNRRMETIRGLFSNFWHLGHLGLWDIWDLLWIIEGSLEVKLPTIWRDEKAVSREKSQKRKDQKKEDAGARKGRKVAKHCVFSWFR